MTPVWTEGYAMAGAWRHPLRMFDVRPSHTKNWPVNPLRYRLVTALWIPVFDPPHRTCNILHLPAPGTPAAVCRIAA
ncbi:hypothetical protein GCM10010168_88030 [Actinoplanes ianthinogenes]|uniref:Uncharacterized protein n=1 Tax=Actinoplanes ianthinogenes TaxID=122358 RepID=A0ABM7LRK1_9ACTN|nr:hypothetical protein Aiant_25630 [Actinoplanes ianthinogenes]GGR55536.1 hypothetical protein GCM10010168_88030 [Actinoplanes ianthinogenes]